jgi:hypothetical protein
MFRVHLWRDGRGHGALPSVRPRRPTSKQARARSRRSRSSFSVPARRGSFSRGLEHSVEGDAQGRPEDERPGRAEFARRLRAHAETRRCSVCTTSQSTRRAHAPPRTSSSCRTRGATSTPLTSRLRRCTASALSLWRSARAQIGWPVAGGRSARGLRCSLATPLLKDGVRSWDAKADVRRRRPRASRRGPTKRPRSSAPPRALLGSSASSSTSSAAGATRSSASSSASSAAGAARPAVRDLDVQSSRSNSGRLEI